MKSQVAKETALDEQIMFDWWLITRPVSLQVSLGLTIVVVKEMMTSEDTLVSLVISATWTRLFLVGSLSDRQTDTFASRMFSVIE